MKNCLIIYILPLSLLFSNSINTRWGTCNLILNGSSISKTNDLISIIKNTTNLMSNEYGNIDTNKFSIHIVENINDYNKYTDGTAPIWSIGLTKSYPDRVVIKSPSLARISLIEFYKIVKHELNHIYINRYKNRHSIPQWFKEGFASLVANQFSLKHKIIISKNKWKDSLIPIESLVDFNEINSSNSQLAYSQSYAFINALQHYYGNEIIINILRHLDKGKNFNESVEYITGNNIKYINNQLANYLTNNYNWMILLDIPNMVFSIFPFILIIGFIYMKNNNLKKIKKWEEEEMIELAKLEEYD